MKMIKATAVAVGLSLAGAVPGYALPQFTFDPSAVGMTGSSFTADNMILSDFTTVTFTPDSSGGATFTDVGTLPISAFQLGGSPLTNTGINTDFGLYFQVSATGVQNTPGFDSGTVGAFTSLNYGLYGYSVTGPVTYQPTNSVPTGVSNPILLASGSLISGGVGATTLPNLATVPNVNTLLTFTPTAQYSAFFASPTPFYGTDFAAFTNNPSQFALTSTGFVITNGGGSANFLGSSVEEPSSLTIPLLGIAGLLVLRGRKRARSNTLQPILG